MPVSALLLDLDGTLADTNAAHAEAFVRAATEHGFPIPRERFDREIGKGADLLVGDVFGEAVERTQGDAIRDSTADAFHQLAATESFSLFDGAETLIAEARARGLLLALATSSAEADLEATFESVGTDLRDRFDVVGTASDVDASKPAPDLIAALAEKLGVDPSECVLVGDTIYDGEAATRGGAAFVGVATWVWDADALRQSGARAVYPSPAALADDLDAALAAAAS